MKSTFKIRLVSIIQVLSTSSELNIRIGIGWKREGLLQPR